MGDDEPLEEPTELVSAAHALMHEMTDGEQIQFLTVALNMNTIRNLFLVLAPLTIGKENYNDASMETMVQLKNVVLRKGNF